MIVSVIMAEIANHAENQPWPSLEWASWIFDRASFVLVGSLLFGAAATIAIVWMGIVKEHHWDLAREHAAERTASLELETAKANEEIAKANEGAAEANARAVEAQLALEKFKAPRGLNIDQRARVITSVKQFAGTPFDISVNLETEPQNLAKQIGEALKSAGWVWKDKNNTPGIAIRFGGHSVGLIVGFSGMGLEIDIAKSDDWDNAVLALGNALMAEGLPLIMNKAMDKSASPDAVHLYFGPKK